MLLRRLRTGLGVAARGLLALWPGLAIYFHLRLVAPWAWLAFAVATLVVAALFWASSSKRAWRVRLAALAGLVLVAGWFASLAPSHDRPWRDEVAVMPRAILDGDRVRLTGYRNFEFHGRGDFTPSFEEREVSLEKLTGVDLYISYFWPGPVAHTFVSFLFEDEPPVAISIETRPEVGEGFDPVASLFKRFELIYVVGDERDLVGSRAGHRGESIYRYHIETSTAASRRLFLEYVRRIEELAAEPEWYHLLKNSCTINIVRYANIAGRVGALDYRHVLNGWVDRYLYDAGLIARDAPFAEVRRRARVDEIAQRVGLGEDFSARIRAGWGEWEK